MPKSQVRYRNIDMSGSSCSTNVVFRLGLTRRSLLFSPPPRKVSFEDGKNNSSPSIYSDDVVLKPNDKKKLRCGTPERVVAQSPGRKRPLLVRPTTSLSLVDLAKSATHDSGNPTIEQSESDRNQQIKSKRSCSVDLSPNSVIHMTDILDESQHDFCLQPIAEGGSDSIRPSSWGHFIDMAPYEEHYNELATKHSNYGSSMVSNRRRIESHSSKEAPCRANRRLSPYVKHKTNAREGLLSLSLVGLKTTSDLKNDFRLRPRKNRNHESAEELIGVFSELQVQHVQNTI